MKNNHFSNKIFTLPDLLLQVVGKKKEKKQIVFTNGCFDLIHLGHIEYLFQAAQLGDFLIVGVNSDDSVKRLNKGLTNRPVKNQQTRASILAALSFVDAVVVFEDDTPLNVIQQILPDILVKGGDWKEHEIVGADIVKQNNGIVQTISFVEGFSSSNLIKKIIDGKN
jgi:D-glycero-beta-D-manno-heptose 1-phosphate adenylyltransferase